MPISVTCTCGAVYTLKDDLAGRRVRCPKCSAEIAVPGAVAAAPPASARAPAGALFQLNKYFLNQKLLRISEQYAVLDEQNRPLLFIERPAHVIRRFLSMVLGIPGGIAIGALVFYVGDIIAPHSVIPVLLAGPLGFISIIVIMVLLEPRRHVHFYADERRQTPLLRVHQNEKLTLVRATFDILGPDGTAVGYLIKPQWSDFFRKEWRLQRADRSLAATAHEDSLVLALLRRLIGPMFGLLRTNFIICRPGTEQVLGEFNRKMTIRDSYVLDMSADSGFELDRRLALALAVMLDTGERR